MASTKISRKQLLKEPDEFLTFSAKALGFIAEYRQRIAIGVGVLVALALVLVAVHVLGERNHLRALDMLNAAMATYQQAASVDGPEKAYTAAADQYRQLEAEYGNTAAGRLGRWVFAGNCLAAAKYDEAIDLFQVVLGDADGMAVPMSTVYAGLGHAHVGKAQWADAAEAFEKSMSAGDAGSGGDILFQLGLVYERLGQTEKSREAFERVVSDYSDTVYASMARDRVGAGSKTKEG